MMTKTVPAPPRALGSPRAPRTARAAWLPRLPRRLRWRPWSANLVQAAI